MRRLLALCAVAAAAVLGAPAQAQDFPSKLIHIIVPFTPGGSNDVLARELAAGFQARWKESAVVENRPGGGGIIAYTFVAKAPPDGYTLMVVPASFTMLPHLTRNPGFNPMTDYAPINLIIDVPFVMVVPPTVPAKTVREFIALAKASPGQMTYGSVGVGTPQHLGAELFKMHAGVDLIHVPYRGATAAIPDLLAGRMQMFIGAINSLLPLINEGKLTALASTGSKRVASLSDVPTMAETFPGFEIGSGVGLVAPAGTPAAIVETLHRATAEILATPGFHQRMAAIGVDVLGTTPAAYVKIIADDYDKWGKVVAAAASSRSEGVMKTLKVGIASLVTGARMRRQLALTFVLLAAVIADASAQSYPDRAIKVIVPYPAGGPTDTVARAVTQSLSSELGQSVVIENQSGAGGRIAMKAVARGTPDGYTLLLGGTNNNAITPALYKDLDFDAVKDFAPVAAIATDSLVLVVHPSVPAKTLAELVAYAKANPGKLSSGGGVGISPHFLLEFVRVKSGANILFVPYRGAAPAMTDVIAGQIQMHASAKTLLLPQIQAGKLRALAVASATRWPELPDVPTLREAGLEGFPTAVWYGLLAPAGTPAPVVGKLNAAINARLKTAEMQASLAKLSLDARPMTPEQFGTVLVDDMRIWGALAQQTGIKLE